VRASFVFVMMYPIQKRIRCHVDGRIDLKVHPSTIDANHRGMNTHAGPAIFPEKTTSKDGFFWEKQKHIKIPPCLAFLVPLRWVNS